MSLFLLVIGIMIMTRKKINPQTVVTVQNALPRVAISIVLIFFSYAIGALIISMMMPLTNTMPKVAWGAVSAQITEPLEWMGITAADVSTNPNQFITQGWSILAIASNFAWGDLGMGIAMLVGLIGIILALLIVGFIALIKTMLLYIRLLTYIVISPVYFAIGVIPGKENMILDWFKEMASGVLSVAAMVFMIHFAFTIPLFFMGSTGSLLQGTGTGGFINSTITGFFVPAMMLFILITSIKMPKKVSGWIKGDPKKR